MTRGTAIRVAELDAPVTPGMPVIDPRTLSRAQRHGKRCAVPNCRRLLADIAFQVGSLPGGRPVLVCEDCAPPAGLPMTRETPGAAS